MKILVENSSWNNIGDGFYQFSIFNTIEKNLATGNSVAMMDAPIKRSFRPSKKYEDRLFHLNRIQDADLFVFSGPILGSQFFNEYAGLIKNIVEQRKNYVLTSVHSEKKHSAEIAEYLKKYPPLLLTSRDSPTANMYKNLGFPVHDGVCAASLVAFTCEAADIKGAENLMAMSFYDSFEPSIELRYDGSELIGVSGLDGWKTTNKWGIRRHFEFLRRYPEFLGEYQIVRPVHDIGYKFSHLNFARPNSFLSYNPLSYLSVYKSVPLTVSNRVHAVVPALSYGNKAVYVGATERNALLDRLGLKNYIGKLVTVNRAFLHEEFETYKRVLAQHVGILS